MLNNQPNYFIKAVQFVCALIVMLALFVALFATFVNQANAEDILGHYPNISPSEFCEEQGGVWTKYNNSYYCAPQDLTEEQKEYIEIFLSDKQGADNGKL